MDSFVEDAGFSPYVAAFTAMALEAGRDEAFVAACLTYAYRLHRRRLPIVYDAGHLAALLGYDQRYVVAAAYGGSKFYRSFTVRKRSGGERVIHEPLPSLKEIQRWVLDHIVSRVASTRFAKGFIPGLSIRDNARFHRRQPMVLTIDLQDFFPSIKKAQVFGLFRSLGYSVGVSNVLSRLCCLEGSLPQGAPTSPAISNLICRRLDRRLGGYAIRNGWRYTRYADDLTFSGDVRPGAILSLVRKATRAEGLKVHPGKIRLMRRNQRQEVTGVVVNTRLQMSRGQRRKIRQAVYHIRRHGLDSHLEHIGERRAHYLEHLLGLVAHALYLRPSDSEMLSAKTQLIAWLRPPSVDETDE